MNIKGEVKNLEDGTVEINCEGTNRELINKFIDNLKSQDTSNPTFPLIIDEIETFWGGGDYLEIHEKFKPLKKYGYFEINYGEEAKTAYEKSNIERLEIGSLMMLNLTKETKEGFSTTHSDFQELDAKYDVVSTELKSINKNISNLDSNVSRLVDHLGTIIESVIEKKKKK